MCLKTPPSEVLLGEKGFLALSLFILAFLWPSLFVSPAMVPTIYLLLDRESILYDLLMNEGSLFCTYEIHQTEMLQIVFLVSLKSSQ